MTSLIEGWSLPGLAATVVALVATSTAVAALMAAMALLVQRIAGKVIAQRFIWGGAILVTTVATLALPLTSKRSSEAAATQDTLAVTSASGQAASAAGLTDLAIAGTRHTLAVATAAFNTAIADAARIAWQAPRPVQFIILLFWPVATLTLVAIYLLNYRRFTKRLGNTTSMSLDGSNVNVGSVDSPFVFGIISPRIVIPDWLLTRERQEQQLVLSHEQSHIAARDHLLLISACSFVALLPWNAALWFMLSRLRLAIEIDCDTRVLATGVATQRYGTLLIDLSAGPALGDRQNSLPIPVTAFALRTSHLERRLRTMTSPKSRFITLRRVLAVSAAGVATLAACRADLPTANEIQNMDVAAVESRVPATLAPAADSTTLYFVDGVKVARGTAIELSADTIQSIEITRLGASKAISVVTGYELRGTTTGGQVSAASASGSPKMILSDTTVVVGNGQLLVKSDGNPSPGVRIIADTVRFLGHSEKPAMVIRKGEKLPYAPPTAEPLIVIDGVIAKQADMQKINPSRIASVEVVKGQAAERIYGEAGANGVLLVTTRK